MTFPVIRGKRIVFLWAVLAALLFLFPHYIVKRGPGEYRDAGWGFLVTGPALWSDKTASIRFYRRQFKLDESVPGGVVLDSAYAHFLSKGSEYLTGAAQEKWSRISDDERRALWMKAETEAKSAAMVRPSPTVTRKGGYQPDKAFVDFRLLVLMQTVLAGLMGAWVYTDSRAIS